MLYRSARLADLRVAQWGELAAIHHVPSGKTHFVNHASVVLLYTVLQDAKSASAAAVDLALRSGIAETPEYLQQVAELIDRLDALGLVERVAPESGRAC